MVLCLITSFIALSSFSQKKKNRIITEQNKVYLKYSDELYYDEFKKPGVQIVKGNVCFIHKGAILNCDSAYFNQNTNSFEAFGHVLLRQGDTLSLKSNYAHYDGVEEIVRARKNVVLKHRKATLYTDSLDYDRKFNFGYFFEGGKLVDANSTLISDWGEYNTTTKEALFYYNVKLKNKKYTITTDTLYYNARNRDAETLGPSTIISDGNTINTTHGYYNTRKDAITLLSRSTINNGDKTIIGDSLFHNSKTEVSEGFGNVVYIDKKNKNELHGDYTYYDKNKGYALATKNPVVIDYSKKDTIWMRGDTIKLRTYEINTDSMYRKIYCYNKVKMYRKDLQAICDSLIFLSKDTSLVMYNNPIAWNENRQILGDTINIYFKDSTISKAFVLGNALSIELLKDNEHYNQITSRRMNAFFNVGKLNEIQAIKNVRTIFYPQDDKDSTLIGLNYLETDTLRMYFDNNQKLSKIWIYKPEGTLYPISQIPNGKEKLDNFKWLDSIRPKNKYDIINQNRKE